MIGLLMLVPAFAAAVMLLVLWLVEDERPLVLTVFLLTGVFLQFFFPRPSIVIPVVGLLINVVIGVYLSIRFRV